MNREEQLLQTFCSLYFEIKCNNNKKDSFDFFLPRTFSAFKCMYNNINRITELSFWTKGIIGVMMSLEQKYIVSLQRKT